MGGTTTALNVVMLGPPGAGKGTQAERLARARRLPKISTGDILREAVHDGTRLGCLAKATMEAGSLVSDEIVIGIVEERLARDDARAGFVLDGFPRTVVQATALDRMVETRGPLVVLDIVVPEDVLVRRLASRRICSHCGAGADPSWTGSCGKCGSALVTRVDDGAGIVRQRLKVYQRESTPLVDYYSARPTFRAVDGNRAPDVVTADIASTLDHVVAMAAERRVAP